MDVVAGLIDIVLASQDVTNLVATRVFEGGMAQIGEAQYPSVTIEQRTPGTQLEAAPVGDFTIMVACWAEVSDQAWRIHQAVKAAIGRARWSVGNTRCTALAISRPFPIPPEEDGQPIYAVAQLYRVRTFGD